MARPEIRSSMGIAAHNGCQRDLMFLAATKQLYDWFSPSVRPSVVDPNERKVLEEENQMQTSEESVERPRLSERTEET